MLEDNEHLSRLIEILACPVCRSPLAVADLQLRCGGCGRTYPFEGSVPALMAGGIGDRPSFARRLHQLTLGDPRLYDVMQRRLGGSEIASRVGVELRPPGGLDTVLDIGAGTGMVAGLLPPGTRYVWLDNDVLKLRGFRARSSRGFAVLGDAARLPFADNAVDSAVTVAVSHHVPDEALEALLDEAARVTRDRFLFVDAVEGRRIRSRLLWQLDRGRFPRAEQELVAAISSRFEVAKVERFRQIHDYVLCVASPRRSSSVGSSA